MGVALEWLVGSLIVVIEESFSPTQTSFYCAISGLLYRVLILSDNYNMPPPLLRRACGRSADWATSIRHTSRQEAATDFGQIKL